MSVAHPVPARLELDALIAQRDELDVQHAAAVAALEASTHDGSLAHRCLGECGRIHDARIAVQKRIDEHLARERSR